ELIATQNIGIQRIAHHHDVGFIHLAVFANQVVSEHEHLRIGLAETDKLFPDNTLDHGRDTAYSDGNIGSRKGISAVGISYDNRYRPAAQKVDGFIQIAEPVEALIIQKDHHADLINIMFVYFAHRERLQTRSFDIVCRIRRTEVGHNTIRYFQVEKLL